MRGHAQLFSLIVLYPFFAFSQAENFLEQGQVALREERYTDAIAYFTEMIKLNKKDCHAHVLRARAYKSTEQIHEALNDLNAAFALP
ncbi:MAG: hypothetical protein RMJ53_08505, partial [Chitinophagales bacterium]|nr:hypothetical protein [Chitinophagales bacterium]MDW8274251.1 hypothetical protein [Chitinophagales bacterium]